MLAYNPDENEGGRPSKDAKTEIKKGNKEQ
jgi:hypothetical protein